MKTEILRYNDESSNKMFFKNFLFSGSTNQNNINKMKQVLFKAINEELTHKQRDCLIMYYFKNKKMVQIASEQNVSVSTVSRHIMYAKKKLKHIASYYIN